MKDEILKRKILQDLKESGEINESEYNAMFLDTVKLKLIMKAEL